MKSTRDGIYVDRFFADRAPWQVAESIYKGAATARLWGQVRPRGHTVHLSLPPGYDAFRNEEAHGPAGAGHTGATPTLASGAQSRR
jgi:hypothetical protein